MSNTSDAGRTEQERLPSATGFLPGQRANALPGPRTVAGNDRDALPRAWCICRLPVIFRISAGRAATPGGGKPTPDRAGWQFSRSR